MSLSAASMSFALVLGCQPLPDGAVLPVPEGFIIHSLRELVPFDDAKTSGDDRYWLCMARNGQIELFAPPDPDIHYEVRE